MPDSTAHLDESIVESLISNQLQGMGFKVLRQPLVKTWRSAFRLDLLAKRGTLQVAIETKSRPATLGDLSLLARVHQGPFSTVRRIIVAPALTPELLTFARTAPGPAGSQVLSLPYQGGKSIDVSWVRPETPDNFGRVLSEAIGP